MMSIQSELFDRAGQFELLMRSTTDLAKKEGLKQLRDFWIALANEVVNGSENHLREQIAAAQRIQAVSRTQARSCIKAPKHRGAGSPRARPCLALSALLPTFFAAMKVLNGRVPPRSRRKVNLSGEAPGRRGEFHACHQSNRAVTVARFARKVHSSLSEGCIAGGCLNGCRVGCRGRGASPRAHRVLPAGAGSQDAVCGNCCRGACDTRNRGAD